jgi:hypothetical protein
MFRVSGLPTDVSPVAWRGVVCLMAANTADILGSRLRLVDALRSDGWRVVVCSHPDSDVQQLTERGIEHRPMSVAGSRRTLFSRLATYAAFTRTLRRLRPKVVLSWTPSVNAYAALAARSLMLPVITNVSARDGEMLRDRRRPRVLRAVSRMVFGWPTMVFFQHREDQQTFIRDRLVERHRDAGTKMKILYGGSVKPSNAGELLAIANVDGALVGGASLKASDFLGICAGCP